MKGRYPVLLILALVVQFACCAQAPAATWVWQADNHFKDLSYFTDKTTTFRMDEHRGKWVWDQYCPSTVSGWVTDADVGWAQAISSDFGDAWDLDKGITVAARVKPLNEHSQYGCS